MKVLLDTNIIIHREAPRVVNQDIGVLFQWLDRGKFTKVIHPVTVQEIERNPNSTTVGTFRIKLESYQQLLTVAPMHAEMTSLSQQLDHNDNDRNDSILLNEVFVGRVDLFISEDKKIHEKARRLGIGSKVFRIEEFIQKVRADFPDFMDYKVLAVKQELFGNIDLEDPFFDSFRSDYPVFDRWYHSKAGENAKAYVCYEDTALKAFLYLKVEDESENYTDISPPLPTGRRLKIGTFKVVSNGLRIGERFLKIIFDNARQHKVKEVYVTIFDSRPELLSLISLLERFGFCLHGTKTSAAGIEKVYVKDLTAPFNAEKPSLTYPKLSANGNVYIVPIKPEYHTELFPDSILRTESLADFVENQPHRNAISKSYVSHSPTRNLKPGDTLVFYRSGGIHKGVATTIGIVEEVFNPIGSFEQMLELCRKRSVLAENELREYWDRNPFSRPFVIHFLYAYSFRNRPNLKTMLDERILPDMGAVKTINPLERDAFVRLIKKSGI